MAVNKLDISMMEDVGTSASQLVQRDGSGNLPVVDGSQLINVVTGITNSTNDPTISTNPSGGVGTEWHNTTSGEAYICTDATAGENVWTNIGAGSGDVEPPKWWGGRGVWAGGNTSVTDVIDYATIATPGNAIDFGDLTIPRRGTGGLSNGSRGVFSGGGAPARDVMDYITIATPGNATDFGNRTDAAAYVCGLSNGTRGI